MTEDFYTRQRQLRLSRSQPLRWREVGRWLRGLFVPQPTDPKVYGILGRFLRIADTASGDPFLCERLAEVRDEYDALVMKGSVSA